jgi:L-alanine-DL-glutamate epimerase-like enolase superfamily enzyme
MELHTPLCAAVPNARWVEYIPQLDPIIRSKLRIEDGHAIPSEEPGLGIDWDWDAIKRFAIEGASCTKVDG